MSAIINLASMVFASSAAVSFLSGSSANASSVSVLECTPGEPGPGNYMYKEAIPGTDCWFEVYDRNCDGEPDYYKQKCPPKPS